jgi:peroxiredoxin
MQTRLTQTFVALAAAALFSTAAYAGCGACATGKDHKHAKGHQAHAEIGKPAPTFALKDAEGNTHDLAKLTADGKIVVLEWFNPDCPFIKKHYEKSTTMNDLAAKYADKDVVWLSIDSSHYVTAEKTAKVVKKWNIKHPVLLDASGEVGHTYEAKTTPHMYVIDAKGTLVYAGAIDNSKNTKAPDTSDADYVNYVDQALTELLAGKDVTVTETKAYGCSVKYGKKSASADKDCDSEKKCGKCTA